MDSQTTPSASPPPPASPLPALELSRALAAVVEQASVAVVQVEARHRMSASGILWSSDGVVVAADHTIQRDEDIVVGLAGGERVPATLAGRDATTDLAVLRLAQPASAGAPAPPASRAPLQTPSWSDLEDLRVGHLVLAVGRPGRQVRASFGIVSDLRPTWRTPGGGRLDRYLQVDVGLAHGFSGSLLVDAAGRALGLATTGLLRGRALALPASTIGRVVGALLADGRIRRGFLGVGVHPVRLPADLAQRAGQQAALVVVGQQPAGPAERGGVLLGDVLLTIDGQPAGDLGELHAYLGEERAGAAATLRILRAGEIRDLRVELGAR